jgi:hypothetical protein
MVGIIVMWLQNSEKFVCRVRRAWISVIAVLGIVVSKPRPKNTTSQSGLLRAIAKASSGE